MLGWAKRAEEDARCCKHAWHFLLQPSVSVLPDRLMVVLKNDLGNLRSSSFFSSLWQEFEEV